MVSIKYIIQTLPILAMKILNLKMSRSIVLICVLNCFITMAQTKPSLPYIPDPADTLLSKIDSSRYKSPTNFSIQLKKQLITNTKNDEYNNQLFIINDLLTHFPDKLSTVEKVNLYIQATDVYKKTGKYWYAKTTIDSALSNTNRYTYKTQLEKILSFKIEICNRKRYPKII